MDTNDSGIKIKEFKKFRHVTLYMLDDYPEVAMITATSSYIPIEDFKDAFNEMGKTVIEHKITRLVFDKRLMRVFHQPSMEWYFVDWKERMADYGLHQHVKILPADHAFCQSVKIGRKQIDLKYPKARFHQLSIRYADSLEEALLLN
jgi:hypothetical protein